MTKEHELKSWPEYFEPLYAGDKRFELRRDDRAFEVGDILWLREWVPDGGYEDEEARRWPPGFTGRELRATVTYILRHDEFAAASPPDGFAILSLKPWLSNGVGA